LHKPSGICKQTIGVSITLQIAQIENMPDGNKVNFTKTPIYRKKSFSWQFEKEIFCKNAMKKKEDLTI